MTALLVPSRVFFRQLQHLGSGFVGAGLVPLEHLISTRKRTKVRDLPGPFLRVFHLTARYAELPATDAYQGLHLQRNGSKLAIVLQANNTFILDISRESPQKLMRTCSRALGGRRVHRWNFRDAQGLLLGRCGVPFTARRNKASLLRQCLNALAAACWQFIRGIRNLMPALLQPQLTVIVKLSSIVGR